MNLADSDVRIGRMSSSKAVTHTCLDGASRLPIRIPYGQPHDFKSTVQGIYFNRTFSWAALLQPPPHSRGRHDLRHFYPKVGHTHPAFSATFLRRLV